MLTEEQAKEKWCPLARQSYAADTMRSRPDLGEGMLEHLPHAVSGNRPVDSGCRCIASQCMAWRFYLEPIYGDGAYVVSQRQTGKGYCGAFGEPKE